MDLETILREQLSSGKVHVAIGMLYGNPSLDDGLCQLHDRAVMNLFVLPLFPQVPVTLVRTILDVVFSELQTWRWIPHLQTISEYHDRPAYRLSIADRPDCRYVDGLRM